MTTADGASAGAGPDAVSMTGAAPRGSPRPLCDIHDVTLLDLDGVVYLGGQPVPSAPSALSEAAARGMGFAFVTNNASRTPRRIAAHLRALGIRARAEDLVTSAQAAARLVADRVPPASPVLVIGAVGLRQAVRERGLNPVGSARERPAAVVQGYSAQVSYGLLAEGALAVREGALFVASNMDTTMPTPRGQIPGNGCLVQVIVTSSGRTPLVAGKPELPLHREAVWRSGARRPLVVGDRLDTDIEGAVRAGTPSMLVLTGVTDPADVVSAPPGLRPTYLAADLRGLLAPHPEVHPDGPGWSCRGWYACNTAGRLRLEAPAGRVPGGTRGAGDAHGAADERGDLDPCDGLRALCAAAWSSEYPVDTATLSDATGLLRRQRGPA